MQASSGTNVSDFWINGIFALSGRLAKTSAILNCIAFIFNALILAY